MLSSKVEENSYLSKVSDSTTSKKTRDVRIAKAKEYNISFFWRVLIFCKRESGWLHVIILPKDKKKP